MKAGRFFRAAIFIAAIGCITLPHLCLARDSLSLLQNSSFESGVLKPVDNGLFFLERNPAALSVTKSSGDAYTGVLKSDRNDYLYCFKESVAARFDTVKAGILYVGEDGILHSNSQRLADAAASFIHAIDGDYGYNGTFFETDDVIETNAFEDLIYQQYHNSILGAGQGSLFIINETNKDHYVIQMVDKSSVDQFKTQLDITSQLLVQCDEYIGGSQDPFEIVQKLDDFIALHLFYNAEPKERPEERPVIYYNEVDAICGSTGTNCAGYTNLFKILCERYGIETETIESKEMNHAWSANHINGAWYYTDTTWDDASGTDRFLLLTREQMQKTHTFPDTWIY